MLLVVAWVHAKFSSANRMLKALKEDWDKAESKHAGFINHAQEQMTRLQTPVASTAPVHAEPARPELRNQVAAMGQKGLSAREISRSCGIPEGDVDVLLGLARIQGTAK
jgi:hypothetical protein